MKSFCFLARCLIVVSVIASTMATATHVVAEEEPILYATGGGWGHGVGMSQYGALGRAEAGFSHTEILQFYYHDTEVTAAPELVPDNVDVRIGVHNSTVFTPTGQLTVSMDGSFLDTTVNRLTVRRGDGGWYINSSNIDWCRGFCRGTVLTVSFNEGEYVRVSATDNHTRFYAYGKFRLTPASTGVKNCGSGNAGQYCLVIAELTMQQYLYGIDEVPQNWHTEALKAQTIAARSYAVAKIRERANWGEPFHLYTSVKDQEYRAWDRESAGNPQRLWSNAVDATEDVVVLYTPRSDPNPDPTSKNDPNPDPERRVATTFYSSSNGGHTLSSEVRWGSPLPYLESKPDTYDAALDANGEPQNPFHEWHRAYTYTDISRWLSDYPLADLDVGNLTGIRIDNDDRSGYIDKALVTLVGSKRTLEVRDSDGIPYGYRFYYALVRGCRQTQGCRPMLSTNVTFTNSRPPGVPDPTKIPEPDPGNPQPGNPKPSQNVCSSTITSENESNNDQTPPENNDQTPPEQSDNGEKPSDDSPLFTDVPPDAPYAEAVAWMASNGITKGSTQTTFAPNAPITRVQFAALLWRFVGCPKPIATIEFTDIIDYSGDFVQSVSWMWSSGITYGCHSVDPTLFCPNEELTSAQIVTLLWRFTGATPSTEPIPFQDVGPDTYYEEAVRWMVQWGIWVDDEFNTASDLTVEFKPHTPVSRSRMAMYFWNLACSPDAFDTPHNPPLFMRECEIS